MAIIQRPFSDSQIDVQQVVAVTLNTAELHHRWNRWIVASIAKHFDSYKGNYTLYLEGDERTTDKTAQFAELRIDGPFLRTLAKGQYFVEVEINVLCQSHMLPDSLYSIHDLVGLFTRAFVNCIRIHRYGDGPEDDGSYVGNMKLKTHFRERVEVNHYGILEPDIRMTQSTIEGHYRMHLVLT